MKLTLELEIPDILALELMPWLEKNPQLWLGSQSGCSKHGFAVLIIRNKAQREGTSEEKDCLLDQMRRLVGLVITGEAGG
jgi:hypothetical protein